MQPLLPEQYARSAPGKSFPAIAAIKPGRLKPPAPPRQVAKSSGFAAAVTRMRCHPPTLAYVQRRRAEGKTDREIRRCIKRYLARHLYPDPQSDGAAGALTDIGASLTLVNRSL